MTIRFHNPDNTYPIEVELGGERIKVGEIYVHHSGVTEVVVSDSNLKVAYDEDGDAVLVKDDWDK